MANLRKPNYDIDPNQQQIADSGSDVDADVSDPALEGQPSETMPEEEVPQEDVEAVPEELDDADYMDEEPTTETTMAMPNEAPEPPNSQANSADALKTMHLFDLSNTLFDYAEIVEKNLKDIDQTKLAYSTIAYLTQLFSVMNRFKNKLRDFIAEVFSKETYEKNLYTYLVLRNELLSIIKYMRSILHLETLEIDEDQVKAEKSAAKNKALRKK